MLKKFNNFVFEGKDEQDKIDELLDKGIKNLNSNEKELLNRLSKGGSLNKSKDDIIIKGNIKKGGKKEKDYLNNMLGTNFGDDTQIFGVAPEESFSDIENDQTLADLFAKAKSKGKTPNYSENKFEKGDKIIYKKQSRGLGKCDTTTNDGKTGVFVSVRKDGKYSIVFDDGKKLAANPSNIHPYDKNKNIKNKELDPFDEEDWDNDKENNFHRPHIMLNPPQHIGMIRQPNNHPQDFYFCVNQFDDEIMISMTSIDYFELNGCLDDSLGSHSLSPEVRIAMRRAGVYSAAEEAESIWGAIPGHTVEEIRNGMLANGFVQNPQFDDMLNQH